MEIFLVLHFINLNCDLECENLKRKERENFGLLHCLVLPLSIAVIGGDSSITMSTAAFFFFFRRRRE